MEAMASFREMCMANLKPRCVSDVCQCKKVKLYKYTVMAVLAVSGCITRYDHNFKAIGI